MLKRVGLKNETVCTDGVVALREWELEDAQWYADSVQDPDIQRFTTDPPTLTADEVRRAISALRSAKPPNDGTLPDVALLICDAKPVSDSTTSRSPDAKPNCDTSWCLASVAFAVELTCRATKEVVHWSHGLWSRRTTRTHASKSSLRPTST
jgi:hypothetical protein